MQRVDTWEPAVPAPEANGNYSAVEYLGVSLARIDAALAGRTPGRWCIRVNKPP